MGWAAADVAVAPRWLGRPVCAVEGRPVSTGASGRKVGGVEELSKAGGFVAGGRGAAAALSPSGGAGFVEYKLVGGVSLSGKKFLAI